MSKVKGRSYKVVLTNEARVLRELRLKHNLTMREAGARVGVSDSYVSLIENGRTEPPQGEALGRFLKVYGGISEKYFYELVRECKAEVTDAEVIAELVSKLSVVDQKLVRVIVEELARRV